MNPDSNRTTHTTTHTTSHTRTHTRTHRPILRLLLAMAFALTTVAGLGVALAGPAAAAETGWIRAGHLAPGTDKADVRLTPYDGGDLVMLRGVSFGEITSYARVEAGLYTLVVVPAGSDMSVTPMISRTVKVDAGTAQTVIATGDAGDVRAEVIRDDLTPPPSGQAKVRLVSAADDGAVDARVIGGPVLAEGVVTGGSTGYATVDAQTWSIEVSAGGETSTSRVPVERGSVYTLLVADDAQGGISLQAVRDSSGTMRTPRGGMDTGAGPDDLASSPASSRAPVLALSLGLMAAALLLLTPGLRKRLAREGTAR